MGGEQTSWKIIHTFTLYSLPEEATGERDGEGGKSQGGWPAGWPAG